MNTLPKASTDFTYITDALRKRLINSMKMDNQHGGGNGQTTLRRIVNTLEGWANYVNSEQFKTFKEELEICGYTLTGAPQPTKNGLVKVTVKATLSEQGLYDLPVRS